MLACMHEVEEEEISHELCSCEAFDSPAVDLARLGVDDALMDGITSRCWGMS